MNVIVAGTDDHDIAGAIAAEGHHIERVDVANRPTLESAGIVDAAVFVLTEVEQATAISVAKDLNPGLKVVVYADGSLPDFARRQAGHILDPKLLDPDFVAEEVAAA